jgi:hypothetical protein
MRLSIENLFMGARRDDLWPAYLLITLGLLGAAAVGRWRHLQR